jgi:hypothetical protein
MKNEIAAAGAATLGTGLPVHGSSVFVAEGPQEHGDGLDKESPPD